VSTPRPHAEPSADARAAGRADARRNRAAVLAAAAELVRGDERLTMKAVADAAGVSRSILYRHFDSAADLQRAVQRETLARARAEIERSVGGGRSLLAQLRGVVSSLVELGAQAPLDVPAGPPPEEAVAAAAEPLLPLAERLAEAAGVAPAPAAPWLRLAASDLVEICLRAGWSAAPDDGGTVERLLRAITEPLDRGLLLLDADGAVVAVNVEARRALEGAEPLEVGRPAVVRRGGLYEDGSAAPPDSHPLSAALQSGEPQEAVRGHRANGTAAWFVVDVRPLRRAAPAGLYGFVAICRDVSDEKRFELGHLRPAGQLAGAAPPLLDVVRALDEVPPALLPDQLVAEATRLTGGPVGLYVLDIDGSHLLRLAGREDFPARLEAPLALGPELAQDGLPDLTARLASELPGVVVAPMWLRGRAVGVLLALRGAESGLHEVARLGAAALELAAGYTDVMDAARRRKHMDPAAEIQQSLLPPRIARIGSAELAGSVLPSYEVGGDWFDYVENRDGAWVAIADASGKGARAAALGSIALAALRAARRNDATLDEAVATMHETVCSAGSETFYLTSVVGRWHSLYSTFSWINCGHPPPLLLRADDTVEELAARPDLPIGLAGGKRSFRRHQRRLAQGDRIVLYSDGVTRRRTAEGLFGTEGIVEAVRGTAGRSATATARAIQEAVVSASEDPLPDDAAVVVLAANPAAAPVA
jgi:serine phosphatase RsbU (regulator of sigma subunit)/AcrR family transcriptional regulator